jgi:hypothetical protein
VPITETHADTGAGTVISFSGTTFAVKVRSMQLPQWMVDDLEKSTLDTTGYKEYVPSDLVEPGEVSVTCLMPTSFELPTIAATVTETCTITFPLRKLASTTTTSNETTAANIAGSGYFKSFNLPNLQLGTLQEGTFVFKFDGVTGPAFTKSA